MIIVIPCYDEPDLIGTLESLLNCDPLSYSVEVIVVVNEEAGSQKSEAGSQNRKTLQDFKLWKNQLETLNFKHSTVSCLKFKVLEAFDMPAKTAGVGLARKIGMDEALKRFVSIDFDGAIVCLDADCRVSKSYLTAIDEQFVNSDAGIGEMHFEHPFEDETNTALKEGIINYELFLRYYVEGLRQAQFPNAIHTIGSCMLAKASTYAKHGGMNKRKAGEDFYFLHKIIPHEKFVTVNNGTVYPSCRTSYRVPFGTGKAQNDWLNKLDKTFSTYDPQVFEDLKKINLSIEDLFHLDFEQWVATMPISVSRFFEAFSYPKKVALIKSNTKTLEQFTKQFYIWFDGFICLKFVHFARDNFYENVPLKEAAKQLIESKGMGVTELLHKYRTIDLAT